MPLKLRQNKPTHSSQMNQFQTLISTESIIYMLARVEMRERAETSTKSIPGEHTIDSVPTRLGLGGKART